MGGFGSPELVRPGERPLPSPPLAVGVPDAPRADPHRSAATLLSAVVAALPGPRRPHHPFDPSDTSLTRVFPIPRVHGVVISFNERYSGPGRPLFKVVDPPPGPFGSSRRRGKRPLIILISRFGSPRHLPPPGEDTPTLGVCVCVWASF